MSRRRVTTPVHYDPGNTLYGFVQVGGGGRADLPMAAGSNGTGDRRTTPTDTNHHHGHHHHGHHHGTPTSNGHQFGGSGATANGDQPQLQLYDVK